jgi:hypothetical protein
MTSTTVSSIPWGDRTRLLPKAMSYALSLEVDVTSVGSQLRLKNGDARPRLWHLFEQRTIATPEGLLCDVPTGMVDVADGEIGDSADPASPWFWLRLTLKLGELRDREVVPVPGLVLQSECLGVVNFDGGVEAFRSRSNTPLNGSVFGSFYHLASAPAFRWLERRQLYGVGRVRGVRASGGWLLTFSFDLYSAA